MRDAGETLRERLIAAADTTDPTSDYDLGPLPAQVPSRMLRPAAVLIGVTDRPEGAGLILTKRSSGLAHHPGQIALPGGKIDAGDAGPEAAALREAFEEIGLPPSQVDVLGTLPPHETVTGFSITPVLGLLTGPFTPVAEAGEVAEVFTVPLAHVTDPARYRVEQRLWRGADRRYYAVPYGPYYIWGATARILRGLAERLES